jgi:multidrug efflux pump subunit AcrA (membrane-fusion protein)
MLTRPRHQRLLDWCCSVWSDPERVQVRIDGGIAESRYRGRPALSNGSGLAVPCVSPGDLLTIECRPSVPQQPVERKRLAHAAPQLHATGGHTGHRVQLAGDPIDSPDSEIPRRWLSGSSQPRCPVSTPMKRWMFWKTASGVISACLVLLLVTAGTGAFLLLNDDTSEAAPDTTEVKQGEVISTVSATGNIVSARDVGVDFASGGKLTKVFVKEGDRVRRGQVLATVDTADAEDQVDSAQASLTQAEGALRQLTDGPTDEDLAAQDASVAQAQTSVDNAERALRDARRVASSSRKVADQQVNQAQKAVDNAERDLREARDAEADAEEALSAARAAEQQACAAGAAATECTSAQSDTSLAEQTLSTAGQTVTTAEQTLTTNRSTLNSAKQSRTTGDDQQTQSVGSAESSLESARSSYDYTVATARQQLQDPTPGELESARGQVDAAESTLNSARRAVRETTLRSPADGVVSSVSAERGEYVSGGGGAGGTSTDTDTESDSGASGGAGAGASGATSGSTSSTSGFVVLTGVRSLQVEADFSEADVTKVRLGEGASVTFEALEGTAVNATVTGVATTSVVTDNVVTYLVTATLEDPPDKIKIGQTATLDVVLDEVSDALYVPSSAVTTTGNTSTVSVYSGGKETTKTVEVGVVGDSITEIVSGLELGDEVVTSSGGVGSGFPGGDIPAPPGGGGRLGGGL